MALVVAENQESNLSINDFKNEMIGKRLQGSPPQTAGDEVKALGIPDDFHCGLFRLSKETVTELWPSFIVIK
jgi:hypothetical protein